MRKSDKLKNIQKANMLSEQRYLLSKGLLNENLSDKEQYILNNILKEINNLQEADFNKVIKKVKDYASKGLLTAGIISALLATPNITQAQSDEIKQAANIETVDSAQQQMDIDQFIKMLDATPIKTTYDKLQSKDADFADMVKKVFINYDTKEVDWDKDEKLQDWVLNYFVNQGKATMGTADPKATEDLKGGLRVKDRAQYEDVLKRNRAIKPNMMIATAYNYETDEDNMMKMINRNMQSIYWDEADRLQGK
jgi:hypothetical protein